MKPRMYAIVILQRHQLFYNPGGKLLCNAAVHSGDARPQNGTLAATPSTKHAWETSAYAKHIAGQTYLR